MSLNCMDTKRKQKIEKPQNWYNQMRTHAPLSLC